MKTFALAALAGFASASLMTPVDFAFINHVAEFGLNYATVEEFNFRKAIFEEVDANIKFYNETETTSTHGHNMRSTMTLEERKRMQGRFPSHNDEREYFDGSNASVPSSWNWVDHGCVNAVQNQGACGSCWAFSATAGIEGASCIKTGTLKKLSEEELVQCVSGVKYGCQGCNGGWEDRAMKWVIANSGQDSETDYPYTSGRFGVTGSCVSSKLSNHVATASEVIYPTANNMAAMQKGVYAAPTTVAIAASTDYFGSYTSGVLTNASACGTEVDHAVVAVGFNNMSNGTPYWIVRNSWAASWGEKGYVNLGAEVTGPGVCMVQGEPAYSVLN